MDEKLKEISLNPDVIDSFDAEQVAEARAALTEFSKAVKAGELTADAASLDEAAAISARLNEREAKLDEEQAEYAAKIAALEESLGITDEEVEEIEATTEGPEPEEEEESEEEPEAVVEEPEVVMASARPKLGAIANAMPKDRKPKVEEEHFSLVASAGAGALEGRSLSALEYAQMSMDRFQSLGNDQPYKLAKIKVEHKYNLRRGDDEGNSRVLAAVAQDAAANGNLVASGGFCAPPSVSYGFFNEATRAGILTLPTVGAPRGSISIPVSPSLGDFIGQSGLSTEWTNENDIEPTSPATKPVYRIECPEFQECEVAAWPRIFEVGNLMSRFFPEAVANATGLGLIAADRFLNQSRIAFMVAASVAGNVNETNGGTLVNLAHNLASNAADYRETYGMAFDAVLDIVLPHWVRDAAYADSITRDSTNGNALNAWLGALFAELNLRPQFVYDLDPLTNGLFEADATVLMYAPGTVVELDAGELDLGVVRDSTLNSTNDYQIFTEPFVGWCVPGHEVRSLEIPVCANGATGDRVTIDCPTVS